VTADPEDSRGSEEAAADRAPSTTERAIFLLAGMRDGTRPVNLADMALRCLLVDDNSGFLQSARLLLEREGMSVVAVASAPSATELAARSSWRIMAPSSSSSSSRISRAESLSEGPDESATTIGAAACGARAGAAGSGSRFRNKPNAIRPLSGSS